MIAWCCGDSPGSGQLGSSEWARTIRAPAVIGRLVVVPSQETHHPANTHKQYCTVLGCIMSPYGVFGFPTLIKHIWINKTFSLEQLSTLVAMHITIHKA